MKEQKVHPLREAEKNLLSNRIERAARFVLTFSPHDQTEPLNLASLDRAFANWLASDPEPHTREEVIQFIGAAFGNAFVEAFGFEWVVAEDEQGTDFAVHGLPDTADVLIYPANLIAKRWERRETNFLETLYAAMSQDIQQLISQQKKGAE